MLSSTSCCNTKGLASAQVGPALAGAPEQVTPANHAASRPAGPAADLLVLGSIVTNNPAMPTAEAMAISKRVSSSVSAVVSLNTYFRDEVVARCTPSLADMLAEAHP